MSDLLGIGAGAVGAYKTALTTIGENVANSETPGYVRRKVNLKENTPGLDPSIVFEEKLLPGGVTAASITRAWDQFRAADARITAAAAGRAETRETWLSNIETALYDGDSGVGSQLGTFFNAGQTLASNPGDTLGRHIMLAALQDVSGAFQNTAGQLARISEGIAGQAKLEVGGINADLQSLDKVNTALLRAPQGTPIQASLMDERDRLIDSIANRVDIKVSYDKLGQATVTLATAGDKVLADPTGIATLDLTVATDGRLSLTMRRDGNTSPLPAAAGSLSGLVETAQITADRRSELDSMAQDFATAVNSWSANGRLQNGSPGGALLDASGGAAGIRLLTTDPAAIAAASADGTENGNLLTLNNLRGTDGAEGRWAGLVAGHALLLSSAKSEATAATTRRDNSFAARDGISGVDLDQEAAELMRYQQAYNSATKIIQVARETMQTILDIF